MSVALTVTVRPKDGTPFYMQEITAKDWDHVETVQDAMVAALHDLGKAKRKAKAKGVTAASLPSEPLVVSLATPDPDVGNDARIKVPSDPNLGRKTVTDALEKRLKKF